MGFMVICVGDMIPKSTRSLLPCRNGSQHTVTDISEWIHVCFRGLPVCASITPVGWLPEVADTCKTDVLFRVGMHNFTNSACLFIRLFASFFSFVSPLTETLFLPKLFSHFLFSSLHPSGVPVNILLFLLVIFTNSFHLRVLINLLLHY